MRKNIKNYTSGQSLSTTSAKIQSILTRAGANKIMFEYNDSGGLTGIAFFIKTSKGGVPIKLPARVKRVAKVMYGEEWEYLNDNQKEQAKRTAWRNIQDWIDAQCAMIETDMVKLEEVFLPYMATPDGHTFFEMMEKKGFLLEAKNE